MSIHDLRRNLMRSILTTLGIVIGVAAVIAMMEIGQGSSKGVQKTIARMGANNLMIFSGAASTGGVSQGSGSGMTLTMDDADALIERCPSIQAVAPIVRARTQVVYGNRNWRPNYIYGTTPSFQEVRDWFDMDEGYFFTDDDVRRSSQVCVIGQTGLQELFGEEDAVGKEIRINNKPFKVIGVLSRKGSSMSGQDQDDLLVAPWRSIRTKVVGESMGNQNQGAPVPIDASQPQPNPVNRLYPNLGVILYPPRSPMLGANSTPLQVRFANIDQINLRTDSPEQVSQATEEIRDVLRERHKLDATDPDDFYIRDMAELSKALGSTAQQMGLLLLSVALISLVVGGVGIMNIMRVTMTERTREIGLRMAVGARPRDILRQFLIEAVILCLLGAALGVVLGRGGSAFMNYWKQWPVESSTWAVVASVSSSVLVGVVFGYYPAWKASRLDPIQALRYE